MDKLITYSLLSVIKSRKHNITSLIEIFEDLVESLLATKYNTSSKSEQLESLRKIFVDEYSIEIPFPTLKIILTRLKEKHKDKFNLFSDFSFIIAENIFDNLKKDILNEQEAIREIEDIYNEYCKKKGITQPQSLSRYIETNKRNLISYITKNEDKTTNIVNSDIEPILLLYSTTKYKPLIEKLVMGSLMSSYLEIEIDDLSPNPKTLILDTNFIVSALNLHSTESFTTCGTILSISKKLNYNVCVLPETIQETQNLLLRKTKSIEKNNIFTSTSKHSIEHGCLRRKLSSSDLTTIANKLSTAITANGIQIIDKAINTIIKNEAIKSEIYEKIKDRPINKEGALHDATAMLYTKKLRNGDDATFSSTSAFFVTDTHGFLENKISTKTKIPYAITADELLNILWLSCPTNDDIILKTDIDKLLSINLSKKIPDKKMLQELDRKISNFSMLDFNTTDCIEIAMHIAEEDIPEIEIILQNEEIQVINDMIHELSQKIKQRESEKIEHTKNEFNFLLTIIEEKTEQKVLNEQSKYLDDLQTSKATHEHKLLSERIRSCDLLLSEYERQQNKVESAIQTKTRIYSILLALTCFSFLIIFSKKLIIPQWQSIEPIIWIASIALQILIIIVFNKSINIKNLINRFIINRLIIKGHIELNDLNQKIDKTKEDLHALNLKFKEYIL